MNPSNAERRCGAPFSKWYLLLVFALLGAGGLLVLRESGSRRRTLEERGARDRRILMIREKPLKPVDSLLKRVFPGHDLSHRPVSCVRIDTSGTDDDLAPRVAELAADFPEVEGVSVDEIDERLAEALSKLPRLHRLTFRQSIAADLIPVLDRLLTIDEVTFESGSPIRRRTEASGGGGDVTHELWEELRGFRALRSLTIKTRQNPENNAHLEKLSRITQLQTLAIPLDEVPAGLDQLGRMTNLKSLSATIQNGEFAQEIQRHAASIPSVTIQWNGGGMISSFETTISCSVAEDEEE